MEQPWRQQTGSEMDNLTTPASDCCLACFRRHNKCFRQNRTDRLPTDASAPVESKPVSPHKRMDDVSVQRSIRIHLLLKMCSIIGLREINSSVCGNTGQNSYSSRTAVRSYCEHLYSKVFRILYKAA